MQHIHNTRAMLSSAPKPKLKTYAQAAAKKTAKPVSLLHSDISPATDSQAGYDKTLKTRIYRSSRSKGAFLIDVSHCKHLYDDEQCMIELKKQHPKVHACVALNEENVRYLEAYVTSVNDVNDIMNNGVIFPDAKLKVYPCRAVGEESEIVRLKLSNIPLDKEDPDVLQGLIHSLKIFGQILDIGINKSKATGFFNGTGYAVLDIHQPTEAENTCKFQTLSHKISWREDPNESFHAKWNNMPMWCRYCHKDGHIKLDCKESKARILCYVCHEQGHRSFECHRKTGPQKKQDRKSYQKQDRVLEVETPPSVNVNEDDFPEIPSPSQQLQELREMDSSSVTMDEIEAIDEDEQIFADNVEMLKEELDNYTPEQLDSAIRETQDAGEIAPLMDDIEKGTIIGWVKLKNTERAVAIDSWMQHNQYRHLELSSNIAESRDSRHQKDGGSSQNVSIEQSY